MHSRRDLPMRIVVADVLDLFVEGFKFGKVQNLGGFPCEKCC